MSQEPPRDLRALVRAAARRARSAAPAPLAQAVPPAVRDRVRARARRVLGTAEVAAPDAVGGLPSDGTPRVIVVVAPSTDRDTTLTCLAALAAHPPAVACAAVVAVPTADDSAALEAFGVPTVVARSAGAGAAIDAGLALAPGAELAAYVGPAVRVHEGWLDALLAALDAAPDRALAGSRVLAGPEQLAAAGDVVGPDAAITANGAGDQPWDAAHNVVRPVDSVGGACFVVRRDVVVELGGTDPRFASATATAADLSFSARALGATAVYQPAAVVELLRADDGAGASHLTASEQGRFADKWAAELRDQPAPGARRGADRRSRHALVLDHHIPTPDTDSGSVRMWALIELLGDLGFAVAVHPDDEQPREPWTHRLRSLGVEVLPTSFDLDRYLDTVGGSVDVVVASRPRVAARALPRLREATPNAVVLYDTVDLHHVRERRRAELLGSDAIARAADAWEAIELALVRAADATLVVTAVEREVLAALAPEARVEVFGNVHAPALSVPGPPDRAGLVYVANFEHPPNVDGALWFVDEVLPRVRAAVPDTKLRLVGSRMTPEIAGLERDGVEVVGWVPTLDGEYARARVAVAPLRYGAGMKGKVGEALAFGVPVVTTRTGVEGFELAEGSEVLVADGAEDFAAHVVGLLTDDDAWKSASAAGLDAVSARYGPDASRARLRAILAAVGTSV